MSRDTLVIALCFAVAVFFIGNKVYRTLKGTGGCSCGCGCSKSSAAPRPASGDAPCCCNGTRQK